MSKIAIIFRHPIISAVIAAVIIFILIDLIISPFLKRVALEIFYDEKPVSGKTIMIDEYDRFIIPLEKIFIKNVGSKPIKDISIKILF